MKKRSYKITFGLKEGYAKSGKRHSIEFTGKVIASWMAGRLKKGHPVVSGFLQEGQLIFPAAGDDNKQDVTVSPSATYAGELSAKEDRERDNREVKNTLESLGYYLKEQLKQESVYIIYKNKNWCI